MKLLLDLIPMHAANGGTPLWAYANVTGTTAVDTDFPVTNLWNSTTPIVGYSLATYCRVTHTTTGQYTLELDFGAATSNLAYVIVHGFFDEGANTFKLDTGTLGLQTPQSRTSSIKLETWNGSSWDTEKNLNGGAGTVWHTRGTPQLVLPISTNTTASKVRLNVTGSETSALRFGYIGVYAEVSDFGVQPPAWEFESNAVRARTIAGMPVNAPRTESQRITVSLPPSARSVHEVVSQLARYESRPWDYALSNRSFVDPEQYPVLGVVFNELDDSTDAGQIDMSLNSGRVWVDRSITLVANFNTAYRETAITFERG